MYASDTARSIANFRISLIIQSCIWVTWPPQSLLWTATVLSEGFREINFTSLADITTKLDIVAILGERFEINAWGCLPFFRMRTTASLSTLSCWSVRHTRMGGGRGGGGDKTAMWQSDWLPYWLMLSETNDVENLLSFFFWKIFH